MEVELTRGLVALIDDEDAELISGYSWFARGHGRWFYATAWHRHGPRWQDRRMIHMHRLIMRVWDGRQVDHKSGDTLDNRRDNLRVATNENNQANRISLVGTSPYKGVSWNKQKRKWRASIYRGGRAIFLGYFESEMEAALAYDAVARRMDGEFARLNVA